MEKQYKTKIIWMVKNFSSLQCQKIYSDPFVVDGCKWRISAYPKGNNTEFLFLFLEVVDFETLPPGWRRHARYVLSIVNQNSVKRSKQNEDQKWFDEKSPSWSHLCMFPLNEIHAKDSGYLVNGELKIVAEVEVLEVIGKLDVTEDTSTMMETMDQLFPSQVDFVNRIFERHPEIACEFRSKNPNLRTGYMTLLRSVIETLSQPPHELSKTDLAEAFAAMESMTKAGFKLLWLEKKLDEVWEKKEKEEACEARIQEIKEELRKLKQKCAYLEAQQKKEELEVLAAKAPVSFDDII